MTQNADYAWVVVDEWSANNLGEQVTIVGRFPSEQAASEFIETLPDHESGRYGLDGPEAQNDSSGSEQS